MFSSFKCFFEFKRYGMLRSENILKQVTFKKWHRKFHKRCVFEKRITDQSTFY